MKTQDVVADFSLRCPRTFQFDKNTQKRYNSGMKKLTLITILFGTIGFSLFSNPFPVFSQPNSQMDGVQKCFLKHYGGTSERELKYILDKQDIKKPSLGNIIKYTIRQAVDLNITPTTILILFSLPLIGTLSDVLHYMVGLKGYGIYMPTMIAAAFWSMGIVGGLILFLFILGLSLIARNLLYKVKLHYWPRRSISLWIVILGVFLFLGLGAEYLLLTPGYVTAFSILFLILLSEEHISSQRRKGIRVAGRRTAVTLLLAVLSTLLLSWYPFQKLVLLHPEPFLIFVLGLGFVVGRYTGFRLLEYGRFRSAIRKEEEEE